MPGARSAVGCRPREKDIYLGLVLKQTQVKRVQSVTGMMDRSQSGWEEKTEMSVEINTIYVKGTQGPTERALNGQFWKIKYLLQQNE